MIRSVIRQMMALALVSEPYVPSLFENFREELRDLVKYFNDYWMRQIPVWNVFDISEKIIISAEVCEGSISVASYN
jgi:hypothetical protein